MGTDINTEILLKRRLEILDIILEDIRSWDGTIESGLEIVDLCEENLNELKCIQSHHIEIHDEEYEEKLLILLGEQKRFTKGLKDRQDELLYSIQQLNKKKDVVDNYISVNKKSIFIDKDI